jgi:hypothetical protein
MLDIVLRTCDHTDVHPERGKRFIACDKTVLVKKCFISLVDSIAAASHLCDIKLWILDDHSSNETLEFFIDQCNSRKIAFQLESLEQKGYNYSALRQFELCREKGRKWVYSVEDDYLHFPNAIEILLKFSDQLINKYGPSFTLRPDDDPFTYSENTQYSNAPCRLFLGIDRHWRTLYNSHNTFFTHVSIIDTYWEIFASLAKFFRVTTVNEDGTINTIWSNGVSKSGPVLLLSPIPSLAIHISQGNEPTTIDYKKLWDSLEYDT